MILSNYNKIKRGMFILTGEERYIPTSEGVINTSGSATQICAETNSTSQWWKIQHNSSLRYSNYICVGSGATPVQRSDFNLSNDITSSLTSRNQSAVTSIDEEGKFISRYTFSAVNGTGASIVITEMGIYKPFYTNFNSDYSSNVLIARYVLSEPITVPNGKGFTLTVDWCED